jgi:hypothetical protein
MKIIYSGIVTAIIMVGGYFIVHYGVYILDNLDIKPEYIWYVFGTGVLWFLIYNFMFGKSDDDYDDPPM